MPKKSCGIVIPFLLLVVGSPLAEACRYSVRDVGFVEIHPNPYRLRFTQGSVDSATQVRELASLSSLVLEQTNIIVETASLTDISAATEANRNSPISIRLESPDPGINPLPVPFPNESSNEGWTEMLETLVSSPVRERYLERMHDLYGVILLVESGDEQADTKAKVAVEEAVAKTKVLMTQIPKPVNEPPGIIQIPNNESERLLLWSLGIEDRTIPHVAVLFGRGRRIGEVLSGNEITTESLYEILSVIGLDCECGLDRSWMQGTPVPLRWNEGTQEKTARALDFDPENPVVKMEISQILAQGGLGTRREEGETSDPFFGYSERSVSFKELDFGGEGPGMEGEVALNTVNPATGSSVSEETSGPPGLSSLPVARADDQPNGNPHVLSVGILVSLGLSIFAVGFYILFRARRLEP